MRKIRVYRVDEDIGYMYKRLRSVQYSCDLEDMLALANRRMMCERVDFRRKRAEEGEPTDEELRHHLRRDDDWLALISRIKNVLNERRSQKEWREKSRDRAIEFGRQRHLKFE